jgi:hypothetical protein
MSIQCYIYVISIDVNKPNPEEISTVRTYTKFARQRKLYPRKSTKLCEEIYDVTGRRKSANILSLTLLTARDPDGRIPLYIWQLVFFGLPDAHPTMMMNKLI